MSNNQDLYDLEMAEQDDEDSTMIGDKSQRRGWKDGNIESLEKREDEMLFERIKYERDDNLINQQDQKIIQSVIHLEKKQKNFERYMEKKKQEMKLQNLLSNKEQWSKKVTSPRKLLSQQLSQPIKLTVSTDQKKYMPITQSVSKLKTFNDLSCHPDDSLAANPNLLQRKSHRFQNGKAVHENSVLSFLKDDYKLIDPSYKRDSISKNSFIIPFNSPKVNSINNLSTPRLINKDRLSFLSTPKYFNTTHNEQNQFFCHFVLILPLNRSNYNQLSKGSIDHPLTMRSNRNKNFFASSILNTKVKDKKQQKKGTLASDIYTMKKENKAEVEKIKHNFLNFFDTCFERQHEFVGEKQMLRQEISEWYCQNQSELNKLSSISREQLSTLSPEFKDFIQQKNFKKKLFNYMINSLDTKDRYMAIYLYKQDKQLEEL